MSRGNSNPGYPSMKPLSRSRRYQLRHPERAKAQHKSWVERNKEHRSEYMKAHVKKPKARFNYCKGRCKERELIWSLTFDQYDALISNPCFYCDGKLSETGYGIDRLENDIREYRLDNCVPACRHCNVLRTNIVTAEELVALIKTLYRYRGAEPGKLWDGYHAHK